MHISKAEVELFSKAQLLKLLDGADPADVCRKVKQAKLIGTAYEAYTDYSKIDGSEWVSLLMDNPNLASRIDW
jgi:hypothetical protein